MTAFIAAAAILTFAVLAIVLRPLYWPRAAGAALPRDRRTLYASALVLPLAAAALYATLGNRSGLDPHASATDPQMEQMVAALAAKLERDPSNMQGWVMLARSYKVMGRMREAEAAYDRAADTIKDDAQELANYADVVVSNAGRFAGKGAQILEKALKADPQNPMALWLTGAAVAERGDNAGAVRHWQKLLTLLPPDSEDAREVRTQIMQARGKFDEPAPAKVSTRGVTGRVELAAGVTAAPEDIVFVIARVPGERAPVAVMRTTVGKLPATFRLDDSLAMSPESRISALETVEVNARIAPAGQGLAGAAALASPPTTVKVGADGVALKIGKVRPAGSGPAGG